MGSEREESFPKVKNVIFSLSLPVNHFGIIKKKWLFMSYDILPAFLASGNISGNRNQSGWCFGHFLSKFNLESFDRRCSRCFNTTRFWTTLIYSIHVNTYNTQCTDQLTDTLSMFIYNLNWNNRLSSLNSLLFKKPHNTPPLKLNPLFKVCIRCYVYQDVYLYTII